MADPRDSADKDALARWLCQWWESDESDDHIDDGSPFPCRLCSEQAAALVDAIDAGKLPTLARVTASEWEWGVTQASDGIVRRGLTEQSARSVASRGDVSNPRYLMRRALGPWERVSSSEVCSTCGQSFDSPPCSLNRENGWSGHTAAGGVTAGYPASPPPASEQEAHHGWGDAGE